MAGSTRTMPCSRSSSRRRRPRATRPPSAPADRRLSVVGLAAGSVCTDLTRCPAGGVTAGIDFGLRVAAEIAGVPVAKGIQLTLEYDPEPPFRGHPDTVEPEVLASVQPRFAG